MSFTLFLERHKDWLLWGLLLLSLGQSCATVFMYLQDSYSSDSTIILYQIVYILLAIYWMHASKFRISGSFDKGFFYYIFYPFYLIAGTVHTYGLLKGIGIFTLLLIGLNLPYIAALATWQILLLNY